MSRQAFAMCSPWFWAGLPQSGQPRSSWPQHSFMRGRSAAAAARSPEYPAPLSTAKFRSRGAGVAPPQTGRGDIAHRAAPGGGDLLLQLSGVAAGDPWMRAVLGGAVGALLGPLAVAVYLWIAYHFGSTATSGTRVAPTRPSRTSSASTSTAPASPSTRSASGSRPVGRSAATRLERPPAIRRNAATGPGGHGSGQRVRSSPN